MLAKSSGATDPKRYSAELRRRLNVLVGEDARGVTVLTHHGMALRLTGTSLAAADRSGAPIDFSSLLDNAVELLEGKSDSVSDADEARDRVLQGFEYIFVDEYQDIDEQQYSLVSALAGRRLSDPDAKLSVMAVGDDDQNIYGFRKASVEFIRRFQADYGGEITYLVENFRSTQNIIAAANHVIQRAADRMKADHPIRINAARSNDPPGGRWAQLDAQGQGGVRLIAAPADPNLQAQVVLEELLRLRRLDTTLRLGDVAVLARQHSTLNPLRSLCEVEGLRCEVVSREAAKEQVSLMRSREGWLTGELLRKRRTQLVSMRALRRWSTARSSREPINPYWQDITAALMGLTEAVPGTELAGQEVLDALYEAADEGQRHGHGDALQLMTAHGAKGLEFAHVIVMDCADWRWDSEDERRLLYVGMTRAKETLTVMRAEGGRNPYLVDLGTTEGVDDLLPARRPSWRDDIDWCYQILGPGQMDIGYAGRHSPDDPVHCQIAAQRVGDTVTIDGRLIKTGSGQTVGRLANSAESKGLGRSGRVAGILVRARDQTQPQYLDAVRTDRWEVLLVESKRRRATA